MVLLYICKGGPVDLLGHFMFSAHMTQMAIVYLVIPRFYFRNSTVVSSFCYLCKRVKPVLNFYEALNCFTIIQWVIFFVSYSAAFDVIKTDMTLHGIVSVVLFIAAFCMWWPLINQLEEEQTLSSLKSLDTFCRWRTSYSSVRADYFCKPFFVCDVYRLKRLGTSSFPLCTAFYDCKFRAACS